MATKAQMQKVQYVVQQALSDSWFDSHTEVEVNRSLRALIVTAVIDAMKDNRDYQIEVPVIPKWLLWLFRKKVISFSVLYPNFRPVKRDYVVRLEK
jgi:hypothetical protein